MRACMRVTLKHETLGGETGRGVIRFERLTVRHDDCFRVYS